MKASYSKCLAGHTGPESYLDPLSTRHAVVIISPGFRFLERQYPIRGYPSTRPDCSARHQNPQASPWLECSAIKSWFSPSLKSA